MAHTTGLEGVVAAQTRLSHVDGERGELIIAGYPLSELASNATFEEASWLSGMAAGQRRPSSPRSDATSPPGAYYLSRS